MRLMPWSAARPWRWCGTRWGVGGGDAAPAQRVEEGRELAGCIEPLGGQVLPALLLEDPAVELVVPEYLEGLALGVVIRAGQTDKGCIAGGR